MKAARAAYDGPWGAMTATDRGRLLMKMSGLIASRAEELAQAEARDTGKPIGQARADITLAARYFEYYGGAADKLHGQIVPFMSGFHAQVTREPYGVVACIPAMELPRANVRPLARARACRWQRGRPEAGGGRLHVAAAACRRSPRKRESRRARSMS